jgi:hypothetical protein
VLLWLCDGDSLGTHEGERPAWEAGTRGLKGQQAEITDCVCNRGQAIDCMTVWIGDSNRVNCNHKCWKRWVYKKIQCPIHVFMSHYPPVHDNTDNPSLLTLDNHEGQIHNVAKGKEIMCYPTPTHLKQILASGHGSILLIQRTLLLSMNSSSLHIKWITLSIYNSSCCWMHQNCL